MVRLQSQTGILVKKAEAAQGSIRVIGRKAIFSRAAYSVIVDGGNERTVLAGTLEQVAKMLVHKRIVSEASGVVEAVSRAVGDDADLFSPQKVTGGVSGNLHGTDIACLVAIKNGINETIQIADAFGINYLKIHARLMSLRREGLVCRADGALLKFFLTSRGLDTVAKKIHKKPFTQTKK
jgi:hypothetical protein